MSATKHELPSIRQTVFHVNLELKYTFDVNATITFKELKRMIRAAAHLAKNSFKIYHDEEDFSDFDDLTLISFFPNQQEVHFTLFISDATTDPNETVIKFKMNQFCPIHESKFLTWYCFTCGKSICAQCKVEHHMNHKSKEKCDYAQISSHLIDCAFGKEDPSEKLKDFNQEDIAAIVISIKEKLKNKLFGQLHEMLSAIEVRLNDVIDCFNKSNDISYINVIENAKNIKPYYSEGLDVLREDIGKDLITINDDVFLTFDRKYKEITKEKDRINIEIQKYKIMNTKQENITALADKVYTDIYHVLNNNLKLTAYDEIMKDIQAGIVNKLTREEVIKQIFSGVTVERKSVLKESTIAKRRSKLSKNALIQDLDPSLLIESDHVKDLQPSQKAQQPNPSAQPNPPAQPTLIEVLANLPKLPQNPNVDEHSMSAMDIETPNPIPEAFSSTTPDEIVKPKTGQKNSVRSNQSNQQTVVIVLYPKPNSSLMLIAENGTNRTEKTVEFPTVVGVKKFLKDSAHCNYRNRLYVTGGIQNNSPTKVCLRVDPNYKSVVSLASMKVPRANHTLIAFNNHLYAVGGKGLRSCERFSFDSTKWELLSDLNEERQYPMLVIHNNFLYVFGGVSKNDNYLDSIERLNLKNPRGKWEYVPYTNPEKINLKIYGCGIVKLKEEAFFLGGKRAEGVDDKTFIFHFDTNTFETSIDKLDYSVYFKENTLYKFADSSYCNIDEENMNILCLSLK